jgi:hypothetical protein
LLTLDRAEGDMMTLEYIGSALIAASIVVLAVMWALVSH